MIQPLSGVRVLELGEGVAGAYCAKLFADFGADVVKIEPPGGSRLRNVLPARDAAPGDAIETGAMHLHLDTNKRGVVADLDRPDGAALARALAARSAMVIDARPAAQRRTPGLDPSDLRALAPGLVTVSLTGFGHDGPYAAYQANDLVAYALGGPMAATGVAEREPLKLGGSQTAYQFGNVAALAGLAALELARRDGVGVSVEASALEVQVGSIDRRTSYLLYHQWTGRVGRREPANRQGPIPSGIYPCDDGYVQILTIPSWVPRMVEALGDEGLVEVYASPSWPTDPGTGESCEAVLYPWLFERTKAAAAAEAQGHRWPITPLNAPVDLVEDRHFAQRGFWVDVEHPVAGRLRQPGAPFRLGGGTAAWRIRRPAPRLGEHDAEVAAELAAGHASHTSPVSHASPADSGPVGAVPAEGRRRPLLEGVRVLDLTVVWAGPYATMFLADLGAEVIRVDNPYVFPTATRGGMARPPAASVPVAGPLGSYPHDDPGARPWNRHSMFSAHARNKLGCTLDLRTELGRETFLELVEIADVVAENNSVGVLDKLGLGWDVLRARNPRLILLRMPPMGLDGPYRDWIGFGAHFEALCGLTALRGYPDLDPSVLAPVFHMDPATGTTAAFATLLGLRERERTGEGQLIEFAQSENMMQHIGEYLLDAARSGERHGREGNRHPERAPQGCYPCRGEDRWAVVSVEDDAQWRALAEAMGAPDWARDPRFATAAGRRAAHDEIDERLAAWTSGLDDTEVFHRCQAAGVPAAPVLTEDRCLADPHLRARGFFRPNGHDELGTWEFPGHLWRWDGPELAWGP
ncbi:MAG: CoA transferase, partial [Acidimicrobiia bacterium]|nr:CoA transferase [Acidimicrobiia bacterium]